MTILAIFLMLLLVFQYLKNKHTSGFKCPICMRHQKHCESEHIANVGNPLFNVREAAKQCLALEDHLENSNKRCVDCIRKHFLLIEMFLEEAIGLDRWSRYQMLLNGKPERVRRIIADFNARHDFIATSQAVRDLRKEFVQKSFEFI